MSEIEMASPPDPGFAAAFIALGLDILSRLPKKPEESNQEVQLSHAH